MDCTAFMHKFKNACCNFSGSHRILSEAASRVNSLIMRMPKMPFCFMSSATKKSVLFRISEIRQSEMLNFRGRANTRSSVTVLLRFFVPWMMFFTSFFRGSESLKSLASSAENPSMPFRGLRISCAMHADIAPMATLLTSLQQAASLFFRVSSSRISDRSLNTSTAPMVLSCASLMSDTLLSIHLLNPLSVSIWRFTSMQLRPLLSVNSIRGAALLLLLKIASTLFPNTSDAFNRKIFSAALLKVEISPFRLMAITPLWMLPKRLCRYFVRLSSACTLSLRQAFA